MLLKFKIVASLWSRVVLCRIQTFKASFKILLSNYLYNSLPFHFQDHNASEQKQACKKHELYVSFRDLGWQVRNIKRKMLVNYPFH